MSGKQKMFQVGRIALRVEGGNWNAYWAQLGTMKGAIFLGSIRFDFVQSPERKEAFMSLMREGVGDLMQEAFNARPVWPGAEPAPEHERSKQ